MVKRPRFGRRSPDGAATEPAALQRRLNAAAELLEAARLELLLYEDGIPVVFAAAVAREGVEPAGPTLSAPVRRDGEQVGIVHATRDEGSRGFAEADRWLLDSLAEQLSTAERPRQPRFSRRVDRETRW